MSLTLGQRQPRKIVSTHVHPPIPIRNFDWQAHFDGDEPNDDGQMMCGYGRTEALAIADLLEAEAEHSEAA